MTDDVDTSRQHQWEQEKFIREQEDDEAVLRGTFRCICCGHEANLFVGFPDWMEYPMPVRCEECREDCDEGWMTCKLGTGAFSSSKRQERDDDQD